MKLPPVRVALAVGLAALGGLSLPAGARGAFAQLGGAAACVKQAHGNQQQGLCSPGKGLLGAAAAAVSPDGRHVYVAAATAGAISVLARDPGTGALAFVGCVSDDGTSGTDGSDGDCLEASALAQLSDIAVSPDGANVYTTSSTGALAVFARDPDTGMLTQRGCIREVGPFAACSDGYALAAASGVEVSPDGESVYVVSGGSDLSARGGSGALAVFDRNPATGDLGQIGCTSYDGTDGACADGYGLRDASGLAISRDGRHVYVAARESGALTVFLVNRSTGEARQVACHMSSSPRRGPCRPAPALDGVSAVAVAPDGRTVYATSVAGSISWFGRNPRTGGLAPRGCLTDPAAEEFDFAEEEESEPDLEQSCGDSELLEGASSVAVAPDGAVGVTAALDGAFAVFRPDGRGALRIDSCARRGRRGGCSTGYALAGASSAVFAPDGRHVYATARTAGAVAAFEDIGNAGGSAARVGWDGLARVALGCSRPAPARCDWSAGIAGGGKRGPAGGQSAARTVSIAAGERVVARLPVPSRTMRALRRGRRVRAVLTLTDLTGRTLPMRRTIVLERGRS